MTAETAANIQQPRSRSEVKPVNNKIHLIGRSFRRQQRMVLKRGIFTEKVRRLLIH
jgi:hypothetical protein